MLSDLRTVSRIFEFFHIPIQHSSDLLRDIYLKVSKSCDYDNFSSGQTTRNRLLDVLHDETSGGRFVCAYLDLEWHQNEHIRELVREGRWTWRQAMDTQPAGTPLRANWMAAASVVPPARTSNW